MRGHCVDEGVTQVRGRRQRDRETERQRDRETERQRDRQRRREAGSGVARVRGSQVGATHAKATVPLGASRSDGLWTVEFVVVIQAGGAHGEAKKLSPLPALAVAVAA